jgi:mannose-1-phosphate guanylyltransferase
MKVLILAGGYATRLRPLSYALPKLLFPVAAKAIIERTIEHLSRFGVDEVILAVNYLSDKLREHLGEEYHHVKVKYSLEPMPLGTGGPIAFAERYLRNNGTFLVINGDILSEIDLRQMKEKHESRKAIVTIALHEVEDPTRFGVAKLDENSRIQEFVEKPKPADAPSKLINAGAYLMEPELIDRIPEGRKVIIEREIFPSLAHEGRLFGYVHSGIWFDIGNVADYRRANFALLERMTKGRAIEGTGAGVSPLARMIGPVLVADHAVVHDGATVGPQTIVGRGGQIGKDTAIAETILFDHVAVGRNCRIQGAVIGGDVNIGDEVIIERGSVIAGGVRIHNNVHIVQDVHVHPYKEISESIPASGHVV